ncbi:hypothetical protein ACLOJK_020808 [Asimina triloba]
MDATITEKLDLVGIATEKLDLVVNTGNSGKKGIERNILPMDFMLDANSGGVLLEAYAILPYVIQDEHYAEFWHLQWVELVGNELVNAMAEIGDRRLTNNTGQ